MFVWVAVKAVSYTHLDVYKRQIIHNVEMKPKKGGQLARAAGSYVQLVGKDVDLSLIHI